MFQEITIISWENYFTTNFMGLKRHCSLVGTTCCINIVSTLKQIVGDKSSIIYHMSVANSSYNVIVLANFHVKKPSHQVDL